MCRPDHLLLSHTSQLIFPIQHTLKAYKLHLSDLFWPMLGIFGKEFLIFDEFSRFNQKISTLNNAF